MSLRALHDRTVAVWGLGREGRAAVDALRGHAELVVLDDGRGQPGQVAVEAASLGLPLLPIEQADVGRVDAVVRSPGISRYRDDAMRLAAVGLESRCYTALWLADQDLSRVIGVTGTKGKSTTSALIVAVLDAAGVAARHVGNVGVVPFDTPDAAPVYVVELSSYQAADVIARPNNTVLTTLDVDHLPWHGSIERYHADKLNAVAGPDVRRVVLAAGVGGLADAVRRAAPAAEVIVAPGDVAWLGLVIADLAAAVRPAHAQADLSAAVMAARGVAELPGGAIRQVAATFPGLPHRLSTVAVTGGVRFVDDALASNPLAVLAAIQYLESEDSPYVLLLGGDDRGVDPGELIDALARARRLRGVVLMDDFGRRLHTPLVTAGVPVLGAVTGVESAVAVATSGASSGETIVFSPAAPTLPAEGDYRDRAARFATAALRTAPADRADRPKGDAATAG